MLTNEQEAYAMYIEEEQNANRLIIATISGPAGTGKTYLVNEVKTRLKGTFATLAPTHAAARLIGGETIHSFFSMIPLDPDAPVMEFSQDLIATRSVQTIILDECSMVSDDLIFLIRDYCQINDINFICVGDEYQLSPIGSDDPTNVCFSPRYFMQLALTLIVRQAAGSNIITLSSQFRQYNYIPDFNIVAKNMTPSVVLDSYSKDWARHWCYDTTIIGFTNTSVMQINSKIVQALHSDGKLFHVGDTIVLKQPIYYNAGQITKSSGEVIDIFGSLANGAEVLLSGCSASTREVVSLDRESHMLTGFTISIEVNGKIVEKFLIDYDSVPLYSTLVKKYRSEWKRYSSDEIKMRWLMSKLKGVVVAYHKYASTVHLAQGKSHEKTMFMLPTLYGVFTNNDIQLYNRLSYVACTRPKQQLILTGAIYK